MTPGADLYVKLTLIGAILLVAAGLGWWFLIPRSPYDTEVGMVADQRVPFSHKHHVLGLGIDCRMCHTTVETGADAGLPPLHTCMTCHSQIWTNAAILAPIRRNFAGNRPILWQRVNVLPDYVYFNHSIHIAKGIACAECHGDVAQMPLLAKAKSFTMQFCLDCHRRQHETRDLTDCSTCHR